MVYGSTFEDALRLRSRGVALEVYKNQSESPNWGGWLDGRNRAIVIAESLASLAFVGGHISFQNSEISPHRPCVRCAAVRIARLAFARLTFVPHGAAEWLARVDRVR